MWRGAAVVLTACLAVPAAAPFLRFEKLTYDFGTIRDDAKQSASWAYSNTGTGVLEIVATLPSCGCTASVAEPKSVPPGGTGAIAITFDPAGLAGDVRKTLTVVSNDPARKHLILTILAKVIPRELEALPGGHPPFTGQSLLMGSCASCHAAPAANKSGAPLWGAVCAMCHGAKALGGRAPGVATAEFLAEHDDTALAQAIAFGTVDPKMPGFSDAMGGPLDRAQVASLVVLLRSWGPAPAVSTTSPR